MLTKFIKKSNSRLFIQPRMGFGCISLMRQGIQEVKNKGKHEGPGTIGTITLDSFTRNYHFEKIIEAFQKNRVLNGFPLMYYPTERIQEMLLSLQTPEFLIQVRHGMPEPLLMIQHMVKAGLTVTEGGPVSYCMPYSRKSLDTAFQSWRLSVELLAHHQGHLESFAGCLLGQLCPPSIRIALSLLEGLFYQKYGLDDISLSYAQGYNLDQDIAAVQALHTLRRKYLNKLNIHTVIYTFMGIYPVTALGHERLLADSVKLAMSSGAERLVVKTAVESFRIPQLEDNIHAIGLAQAYSAAYTHNDSRFDQEEYEAILEEAEGILTSVLNLGPHLEKAIMQAFKRGLLDIPYCLHPENFGRTSVRLDQRGYIIWDKIGKMSLKQLPQTTNEVTSAEFLQMLYYNRNQYDTHVD
jgi:methylaspartate mutase epsilon subunit